MRRQALDSVRRALNIDESTKASKASRTRDAAFRSLVIRVLGTDALGCGPTQKG